MPSKPFRFLDLPPEIREKVYILVCTNPVEYTPLDIPYVQISFPHNLLLTNTQLYQESRPIYFTTNAFSFTIRRHNDLLTYFLSPPFLDNRRQIRSLRIAILRWGTKSFFLKRIVPILEDCILNGRLRILKVVVRESFLGTLEKMQEIEGITGVEYENWRVLRRLLRDPYLERVVLLAGAMGDVVVDREMEGFEDGPTQDVTWLLKEGSKQSIVR